MKLDVGDTILGTQSHNKDVVRIITVVRPTGYTWRYPDVEGIHMEWWSENSNDSLFDLGWELIQLIKQEKKS